MLSVIEMTRREAIANGFPTQLWLDAEKGLYGMRELQGVQADVLPGVDEKKQLGKRIYRMPPELLMELNDTSTIASIIPSGRAVGRIQPSRILHQKQAQGRSKNPNHSIVQRVEI